MVLFVLDLFFSPSNKVNSNYKSCYCSDGLDENYNPIRWDAYAISYYGNTNAGISGLLLSFPYSIGYLSIADAETSKVPFADIINKDGIQVMKQRETDRERERERDRDRERERERGREI